MKKIHVISKSKMECKICYECLPECRLTCGHSFCYQCVKTWYQKGSHTCPMCRGGMCFRGFVDMRRAWDMERREGILEEFVTFLMDDMGGSEYLLDVLEFVHERFNTLMRVYPGIDDELLEFIIRAPYFRLDVRRIAAFDEFPTYMRYLMVPKTANGVRVGKSRH